LTRHPYLLKWIRKWTGRLKLKPLMVEEWFQEGHGIIGGARNDDGIWIPNHAPNGVLYLWAPPPVIADVAMEELLKAIQKRQDAFHVFCLPRLYTPKWRRLFFKSFDFHFSVPAGSDLWPSSMHEPLWIGISLPFVRYKPWSLRGTPILVEMARNLRSMLHSGEGDGRDILQQLLRVPGRVAAVSESVARGLLHLPGPGDIPDEGSEGRRGKCLA